MVYAHPVEAINLVSSEEQKVLDEVRKIQREGQGYGEVVVTVKAGKIATIRRAHVRMVNEGGERIG